MRYEHPNDAAADDEFTRIYTARQYQDAQIRARNLIDRFRQDMMLEFQNADRFNDFDLSIGDALVDLRDDVDSWIDPTDTEEVE